MALGKWEPWKEIEDRFDRYTRAGGAPRGVGSRGEEGRRQDYGG